MVIAPDVGFSVHLGARFAESRLKGLTMTLKLEWLKYFPPFISFSDQATVRDEDPAIYTGAKRSFYRSEFAVGFRNSRSIQQPVRLLPQYFTLGQLLVDYIPTKDEDAA